MFLLSSSTVRIRQQHQQQKQRLLLFFLVMIVWRGSRPSSSGRFATKTGGGVVQGFRPSSSLVPLSSSFKLLRPSSAAGRTTTSSQRQFPQQHFPISRSASSSVRLQLPVLERQQQQHSFSSTSTQLWVSTTPPPVDTNDSPLHYPSNSTDRNNDDEFSSRRQQQKLGPPKTSSQPTHSSSSEYQFLQGLNPSQIEAVTQPSTAITRVVAGPGSGKTRVLTCRIAYLLQQHQQDDDDQRSSSSSSSLPPRILAVTFTRKAAGEMQERLKQLLIEEHKAQQQDIENAKRLSSMLDTAVTTTTTTTTKNTNIDHEIVLVQDQYGNNIEEEEIQNPPGLDRVMVGTFHSICARILRWNGDLLSTLPSVIEDMEHSSTNTNSTTTINLDRNFAICDQSEQLRIIKESLTHHEIDLKRFSIEIKPLQILTAVSQLKTERCLQQASSLSSDNNEYQESSDINKKNPVVKIALQIYADYRESLLSTNCIDFDDLIQMTRELLQYHPTVRQQIQRTWPHILVDEFQDTSKSQMDLVKLLTSSSLFVVGDADQSIYSWRGANAASLSEFAVEFQPFVSGGGGDGSGGLVNTVYLMENYRSTSNIVKAAQKVISTSSHGYKKSSSLLSSSPSSSSQATTTGADELRQNMKPKRGAGPKLRVVAFQNDKGEADFVISEIQKRIRNGEYTSDTSVALIYRTNAQSRALEESCVVNNIPYVIFGSATSFYKRHEIKDCLCFFRWLQNGHDRSSMLRAFKTPTRGLGDKAVNGFDAYYDAIQFLLEEIYPSTDGDTGGIVVPRPTPLDIIIELGTRVGGNNGDGDTGSFVTPGQERPDVDIFLTKRQQTLLGNFGIQMNKIRDLAHTEPVEKVLVSIVDELELLPHWDKISKSKAEYQERQSNFEELRRAAVRYSRYGPCMGTNLNKGGSGDDADPTDIPLLEATMGQEPLTMFLDDVALVTDLLDKTRDDSEKRFVVSLMTIHASKGLEFDSVFVVGNEDGTFPTSQAIQEGAGSVTLEEEKRLCYVAMTRAKTELMMTWRKEVKMFTANGVRTVERNRSRFLDVLVGKKSSTKASSTEGNRPTTRTQRGSTKSQSSSTNYNTVYGSQRRRSEFASSPSSSSPPPPPRREFGSSGAVPPQRRAASSAARQQPRPIATPPSSTGMNRPSPHNPVRQPPRQEWNGRETNDRPRSSSSSPPTTQSSSAVPSAYRQQQQRQTSRPNTQTSSSRPQTTPTPKRQKQKTSMDSTWFFPVGTTVHHARHGKGRVLEPPAKAQTIDTDLPVLVQFKGDVTREFCARGSDISPIGF